MSRLDENTVTVSQVFFSEDFIRHSMPSTVPNGSSDAFHMPLTVVQRCNWLDSTRPVDRHPLRTMLSRRQIRPRPGWWEGSLSGRNGPSWATHLTAACRDNRSVGRLGRQRTGRGRGTVSGSGGSAAKLALMMAALRGDYITLSPPPASVIATIRAITESSVQPPYRDESRFSHNIGWLNLTALT